MNELKLRRPSFLVPLSAAFALAFLGAACGGSASLHDGAGAASNGGVGGSSPGAGSTAGVAGAADGSGAGGSSANGGAGASRIPPHQELCLVVAGCIEGTISGLFGTSCTPFSARCEFGCREHPLTIQTHGQGNMFDDRALAAEYASDALCNASAGGDGGSGGDNQGDGGAAQAGDGGP